MASGAFVTASTIQLLYALVAVASALFIVFGWKWMRGRHERALARDIAQGRYASALEYFLERGRYLDAGSLEEARGNIDRAAEYYERGGELGRAAAMYAACGEHGLAALAYRDAGLLEEAARSFLLEGKYELAAPLLESIGDDLRLAECWNRLNRPSDEAAAFERAGELERAASIWLAQDQFAKAASLYRRSGATKRAASAYWRCGNVNEAAEVLTEAKDWVTLGRLWKEAGYAKSAITALARIDNSHADFREACVLKARIEKDSGDLKSSIQSYQRLISHDVQHGSGDDFTRGAILTIARYHFRNHDYDLGFRTLERVEELRLMKPGLAQRIEALKAALTKEQGEASRSLIDSLGVPSSERYEMLEEVGRGGNGVIWRAKDRNLDRTVAVKLIHRESLENQRTVSWFMREAKTAARLNHPNIVTIYDIGVLESQPYIAMEFVDGETLVQYIERTKELPVSDELLKTIVASLVGALSYAHQAGVVHLDIKLENVMVSSQGEVKLMDFGLARALNDGNDSSVVSGTPLYMAPEQITGKTMDHRTDIYSLGVMLYVLTTGAWPVGRERTLYDQLYATPKDPREHRADLSADVAETVLACLSKKMEDRPKSVMDVAKCFLR